MLEAAIALIGVLVGLIGSVLTVEFQDRRGRTRERNQFQRETMLELQEQVAHLMRQIARANFEDLAAYQQTGTWGKNKVGDELAEEHRAAMMRVAILSQRATDEQLRQQIENLSNASAHLTVARDPQEAEGQLERAQTTFNAIQERLGTLLRSHHL